MSVSVENAAILCLKFSSRSGKFKQTINSGWPYTAKLKFYYPLSQCLKLMTP